MKRAVVLFSGGLDSMLAVRILQEQDFEVDALNIRTVFSCCRATAAQAAVTMGARLTVLPVGDDYIDLIRNPSHAVGRAVNPCVDCRAYMARMAKRFMHEVGACLVATGELLGQRPASQKAHQLKMVAKSSGLEGRLLRPLSAKLLGPTIPEKEGLVDREKLYAFTGRGRGPLIELAEKLGLPDAPTPSTGCALTEVFFAPRVRDLIEFSAKADRWDFELLNYGRQFRFSPKTKVAVGRNESENAALRGHAAGTKRSDVLLLCPEDFLGPDALIVGDTGPEAVAFAGALIRRYSRLDDDTPAKIEVIQGDRREVVPLVTPEASRGAQAI